MINKSKLAIEKKRLTLTNKYGHTHTHTQEQ
jgi:hypothetical protein